MDHSWTRTGAREIVLVTPAQNFSFLALAQLSNLQAGRDNLQFLNLFFEPNKRTPSLNQTSHGSCSTSRCIAFVLAGHFLFVGEPPNHTPRASIRNKPALDALANGLFSSGSGCTPARP